MATGFNDRHRDRRAEEELDRLNEVLVYILIENTDLNIDDVYSIVFSEKGNITWH